VGQVGNLRADCQSAQQRGLPTRAQAGSLPHKVVLGMSSSPEVKVFYPT